MFPSERIARGSGNVFADLGYKDAEDRQTKLRLAHALNRIIDERRLSQAAVAARLGINQPKVSALRHYKLEGFSVERLMTFLTALDRDVEIVIRKKPKSRSAARIAARRDWGLQGWMKNRVYPDFLVRLDADGETARLLVLETKGKHLEGSEDTEFKAKFFELLEDAYARGKDAGEVELFSDAPDAMRFRILLQEPAWENNLEATLA